MPHVVVDGIEIELGASEHLNGIQAARKAGVEIPHYCWHPGLSVVASCRMCLVESGRKDPATGQVAMVPKLVPACQTPAIDGTIFVTNSDKVREARAMVEEDLLLRHPVDCPICDKAGECSLQDYHFQHGREERRADIQPFHSRRRPVGETVTLFVDRCVMCTRCVRFTREISGTKELMVTNRGIHEEIDVFPGFPLENKLAGNVVDLCPVGALGDVDFLYSQRVWFMRRHDSVCAGCSTGCSISIEENQDRVYRLKPRENPFVNQWWMCDEGRYGFHSIHSPERLTEPQSKNEPSTGEYVRLEAHAIPEAVETTLRNAKGIALIVSPFLTVEETYLLASYVRSMDPTAILGLGPIPHVGEDEIFPTGFTIHAEKCPNRRGVEMVLSRFEGGGRSWDSIVTGARTGKFDTVWMTGGYPPATSPSRQSTTLKSAPPTGWMDVETASAFAELRGLIVQDMFSSPLMELATIQLPGVSFAERAGSYVNANDRLQSFSWAIRPPAGAISEGQLAWRLLKRPGMYRPVEALEEMSLKFVAFEGVQDGVPAHGVDLKVAQLAKV